MSAVAGATAVVTGTTGGMGLVIARELALAGAHVIAVVRTPHRMDALRKELANVPGAGALEVIGADLSLREGIRSAIDAILAIHDEVNVLVNNAGAHFGERRVSPDGLELHVAINYLAGFGLSFLLRDALRRGRARVVNVASDTLRDTRQLKLLGAPRPATLHEAELDDLTRLNAAQGFVPFEAYARAKLLTVMAGYELARELADTGVTINAVHPGIVATDIIDDLIPRALRPIGGLIRRSLLTPEQGAASALRLATDPALDDVTGRYFVREVDTPTPAISYDVDAQARLRIASEAFLSINR